MMAKEGLMRRWWTGSRRGWESMRRIAGRRLGCRISRKRSVRVRVCV